ncbi:hypothetical protein PPL_03274 [Heterostelium album PN500]|uniref:Ubiquitin-like domain-containing protein n=1 Tax=Heterostelium pallidum (strain ATCC 26659 / Pp 5 / PN500) TaxID=670386 RepID=D3B4F0_HETP5|nr:hypothetical protein PPL_03274 [Heterostelium album PN500]EFA84198.1 hypothetical protein PPL_03274 [Heterostelium album PN500]|eukprot:XP_020436314.1 hypothetical protein PPL_03274 [Heterostelium album PN500]
MIILIKTPTVTFSLDIDSSDNVSVLLEKVKKRATLELYQFQLTYAGSTMNIPDEPLSNFGIKKESTIHMNIIKELTYDIEYNGTIHKVPIVNNPGVLVSHLKQVDPSFVNKLVCFKQGNNELKDYSPLQTTVETNLTIFTEVKENPLASTTSKPKEEEIPQISNEEFTSHFLGSTLSNDVEIVFCFDTTGSMYSVLNEVRAKVRETVTKLLEEIPSIRIGVVGIGDFCDHYNVIRSLNLTSNVDVLCKFIMDVPRTSGGDEDEAYELALQRVKSMSWSKHTSKAIVMIGDSAPHAPYYTTLNINWLQEVDDLESLGIKIYGVVCQHERNRFFYQMMAERTGGLCIKFDRFNLITEMFLAICYRESSKEKYQEFKNQMVEQNAGGSNDKDMNAMFSDLDKENFKVGKMYDDEEAKEDEATTTTTTTTTTTGEDTTSKVEERPIVIKKRYGVLNQTNNIFHECVKFMSMDDRQMKAQRIRFKVIAGLPVGIESYSSYKNPAIAVVLGSLHIGFTSFSNKLIKARLHNKGKLVFHDYRLDSLSVLPLKPIFVAAYAHDSAESFDALRAKIDKAREAHPDIPIVLMGLKSDLKVKESSSLIGTLGRSRSKSMAALEEVKRQVTKHQRQLLIEEKSLYGEIECTIKTRGSVVNAEQELYKLFTKFHKDRKSTERKNKDRKNPEIVRVE